MSPTRPGPFVIWTPTVQYLITVKKEYLGCMARQRYPRRGESHTRGSDLPDGKNDGDTRSRIIEAIIKYDARDINKLDWPIVRANGD